MVVSGVEITKSGASLVGLLDSISTGRKDGGFTYYEVLGNRIALYDLSLIHIFLKSLRKGEGELADDELNSVAGGCNSTEAIYSLTVAFCIGFAIMSAVDPVSENKDDWGDKLLCDI